jgi:hypothetical protein
MMNKNILEKGYKINVRGNRIRILFMSFINLSMAFLIKKSPQWLRGIKIVN